jgi:hypothetical protein
MAMMKTSLVTASCGLVLLGAVAAQAAVASNGASPNGLTTPVPSDHTLGTPPSQGFPLHGRTGGGKTARPGLYRGCRVTGMQ